MPDVTHILSVHGDNTIVLIALLLVLLGVGYVIMRAAADRLLGVHDEHATYELVRDKEENLDLLPTTRPHKGMPVNLDPDTMARLTHRVHELNDLRIHTVTLPDDTEIAFEDYDEDTHPSPRMVLLEASKGDLTIDQSGIIETSPPLDDAVTKDLLTVLEEVTNP